MPEKIIADFEKQYPGHGEEMYYKTANAQGRNKETFKKESTMEPKSLEQLEKELDEEMTQLEGVVISIDPQANTGCEVGGLVPPMEAPAISQLPTTSAGLPETVPGEVIPSTSGLPPIETSGPVGEEPPTEELPFMEKKEDKKKEDFLKQVKGAGAGKDRKGNKHMPPAKKVEDDKKKKAQDKPKHKKPWETQKENVEKFNESVNLYLAKTSRNSDIGVNSLEKIWNECIEAQSKENHSRSSRSFWVEVRTKFDRKVNEIFLQEAKKKMTERQKMNMAIETFLEHVAKDKYVEAKVQMKEMTASCINSMVSERKVQYQKTLAEEIAKKVRDSK